MLSIVKKSTLKPKYYQLLINSIDFNIPDSFYKAQAQLSIKKIALHRGVHADVLINRLVLKFDIDIEELILALGKIEITLDKNTQTGVGYGIVYNLVQKVMSEEAISKPISPSVENYCRILHEEGVVAIPVLSKDELKYFSSSLIKEINNFPEYLPGLSDISKGDRMLVMGGFGALGNPSSLHNLTSGRLRLLMQNHAIEFFRAYMYKYLSKGKRLEQLVDRLSVRVKGTSTTKESWHRDVAPLKKDFQDDLVFGGWVNLDTKSQYFSCVPKTHHEKTKKAGFVQEEKQDELEKKYRGVSKKVECPPGHWIFFFQNIMHEVLAIKQKDNISLKQYFGWRITEDTEPLFPDNISKMKDHGLPQIPSGQTPWMYGPSHNQYHQSKLIEWSNKNFKKECLVEKTKKTGEKYTVVNRFLPSLKEMGLDIYPEYTSEDIDILKPIPL